MSVTMVIRVFPVRVLATVTLGAGLALAAGFAGLASPVVAVAVAVGVAAVVPGVALVWLGMVTLLTDHQRSDCRCVGLLGVGVLVGGLTAAVLPVVGPAQRPPVVAAGLVVVAAVFMPGLLLVPGVVTSLRARLRLALDGLTIGVLLAYVGWLLVPGLAPLVYAATMVAVTCTAITGAAVLRTVGQGRPATRCGGGALLAIVGLALLVATVGPGAPQWTLLVAAGLVVSGPPVVWTGARRVDLTRPTPGPASLDESFGGYPMLAVPFAAAVLATAYHLVTVGLPDRTAVLLSMAGGVALAVREVLATTELRQRARRLAVQEAHLRALVTGTGDVTMVLDQGPAGDDPAGRDPADGDPADGDPADGDPAGGGLVVRWLSPAGRQLGLAAPEVVGRRFTDLVHPDDAAAVATQLHAVMAHAAVSPVLVEARLAVMGGGWRETESTVSDLREVPEVGALVVQVRDVGQRRHLERTVALLASTDQRTGLPNRDELRRAIDTRVSHGRPRGALVVVGLQGLTAVSDLRGRPAGDALLGEVARRIRAHAGTDDVAARLGGNRFAVLTGEGPIEAYGLAVRLVGALSGSYPLPEALGRRPARLDASAGVAALAAGDQADEVVHRGDLALRRASQLGRNQVEWYDEGLEVQLVRRLDLERHLPGAAGRGELDLVYQPVVALVGLRSDSDQPVGVEALLRWRHPVLGRVPPAELMPVADRLGVSSEIGEWVLHTACRQVALWRRDGHDLWLAVNVSARQLAAAGFVPSLAAALSVHQTPPERVTVEVAEAEVAADLPAVASQLGKVRGLGVRTALDGIGTADTDLAWLRRLPLDVVKLADPPAQGPGAEVVAAAADLAQRLGLAVVATGLETETQRDLVRAAGCLYGQGYLVSPPAPAERVEAYLEAVRSARRARGNGAGAPPTYRDQPGAG